MEPKYSELAALPDACQIMLDASLSWYKSKPCKEFSNVEFVVVDVDKSEDEPNS